MTSLICANRLTTLSMHSPSGSGALRKLARLARCLAIFAAACGGWKIAVAQSKTATTTRLAITSGTSSSPVTTADSGSVITLTATVTAASTPLTVGQVNFCDASAKSCTDIHQFGTTQLTRAGTAVFKFRPGPGAHSYVARFEGTLGYAGSVSAVQSLDITIGIYPSATILTRTGTQGAYDLGVTVYGNGTSAPSGAVSFVDTSINNSVLDSVNLTPEAGLTFLHLPGLLMGTSGLSNPNGMAVGDFNGDGIEDLAVANGVANTVAILLGNGEGTFAATPSLFATGNSPGAIAPGDFNHDGILDLAVANYLSNDLTILLGNGDGTFTASPSSPAVGVGPAWIATADFNQDGILDLAVVNKGSDDITVLLGNGNGTFTPTTSNLQPGGTPYFVTTADFNQDGMLDLAVLSNNSGNDTLTIFLGSGAGGFTKVTSGPGTGTIADAMAVADLNNDGMPDLVLTHTGLGVGNNPQVNVSVLIGNKDGTFKAGSQLSFGSPSFQGANAVFVSDFTGDGKPDLAIATGDDAGPDTLPPGSVVTILPGDGAANFSNPETMELIPSAFLMTVGDLNGDGLPDVAAVSTGLGGSSAAVHILLAENQSASAQVIGFATPVATGLSQVVASYAGDTNYQPSASFPVFLEANPGSAGIVVSASSNPDSYGASETLTAKVTGAGLPPGGTVTFYDGGAELGQVGLIVGVATYVTSAFSVGTHSISVSYSGDQNYLPVTSLPYLSLVVQPAAPMMAVSPVPSPVVAGGDSTATVTLTAGNSYSGTMNVTCTLKTSPANAQSPPSCALNPTTVTVAAGGNVTTTLTMKTTGASSAMALPFRYRGEGLALAVLLMIGTIRLRHRHCESLVGILVFILSVAAGGCGGNARSTSPPTPGTTAGTYVFTVTATDSNSPGIVTTATVSLTVQ